MAHVKQSRPDSGLGFQVNVIETFRVVPSSLGSGQGSGLKKGAGGTLDLAYVNFAATQCQLRIRVKRLSSWISRLQPSVSQLSEVD